MKRETHGERSGLRSPGETALPTQIAGRLAGVPAPRIGSSLRRRRTAEHVSRGRAASVAGLSVVELLAIEAGRRSPTPSEVESLLALYQRTLDQILPPRLSLDPSLVAGLSDRSVLGQYLNLVREWRNVDNLSGIRFRPDDLAVLVGIVGTGAS